MTLEYTDDWLSIHGGDARTVLADLPDESVQMERNRDIPLGRVTFSGEGATDG